MEVTGPNLGSKGVADHLGRLPTFTWVSAGCCPHSQMGSGGSPHAQLKHEVSGTTNLNWMCKRGLFPCMEGVSDTRSSPVIPTAPCHPQSCTEVSHGERWGCKQWACRARTRQLLAEALHQCHVQETSQLQKMDAGVIDSA